MIQKGFASTLNGLKGITVDIGKGVGESFDKGFAEGSKPLEKKKDEKAGKSLADVRAGSPAAKLDSVKAGIAGVQGDAQKARNFTLTINGGLIGEMTNHFTTVQESTARIREQIAAALMDAVRDVEIAV